MDQHSIAVAGGDQLFSRTAIKAGQGLMLEPDDCATLLALQKLGRSRNNAGDVT